MKEVSKNERKKLKEAITNSWTQIRKALLLTLYFFINAHRTKCSKNVSPPPLLELIRKSVSKSKVSLCYHSKREAKEKRWKEKSDERNTLEITLPNLIETLKEFEGSGRTHFIFRNLPAGHVYYIASNTSPLIAFRLLADSNARTRPVL